MTSKKAWLERDLWVGLSQVCARTGKEPAQSTLYPDQIQSSHVHGEDGGLPAPTFSHLEEITLSCQLMSKG